MIAPFPNISLELPVVIIANLEARNDCAYGNGILYIELRPDAVPHGW